MSGSILITGANSSLAIPAVQHLLTTSPGYNAILTVRDVSDADSNTRRLRDTIARHPEAETSVRELNLADLSAVHSFAETLAADITGGRIAPLAAIVCNAYFWNLSSAAEVTSSGYEKTFQVTHLAQAALVLRLLGHFGPAGGRIVLFSSDAHWPGKNSLEKYPPAIPQDLELLVKGPDEEEKNKMGRGFQRYANAKLAVVMWTYALNRYLEKDPTLSKITAVSINPGNLSDSRALRTNTPFMLTVLSRFVIGPLRPLLRLMDPTMRLSAAAGADVVELATNRAFPGERGYFTMLKKDESSPDSRDETVQMRVWEKTLQWGKVTKEKTALKIAF